MTVSESDCELAHLRSTFDGLLPAEVFTYLCDERRTRLEDEFALEYLDPSDTVAAVFKLIETGGDCWELASRLEKSWLRFLDLQFTLDKQGTLTDEAFQAFVEENQ